MKICLALSILVRTSDHLTALALEQQWKSNMRLQQCVTTVDDNTEEVEERWEEEKQEEEEVKGVSRESAHEGFSGLAECQAEVAASCRYFKIAG